MPDSPARAEGAQLLGTERQRDASFGELLGELTRNLSTLIRGEVALVRLELSRAIVHVGIAMALFVLAGLMAFCAYIFFLMMLHSLFVQLLGPWIGELVVMAILLLTAGGVAFVGVKRLEKWKNGGLQAEPEKIASDADTAKGPGLRTEETHEVN